MVAILVDALRSGGLGTLHHLPRAILEEIVDDTFSEARQKYFGSVPGGELSRPGLAATATGIAGGEATSAIAS